MALLFPLDTLTMLNRDKNIQAIIFLLKVKVMTFHLLSFFKKESEPSSNITLSWHFVSFHFVINFHFFKLWDSFEMMMLSYTLREIGVILDEIFKS